jgi:hypothetical protein
MTQNTYPLSSSNQQYIPLDVIESKGHIKSAFNASTPLATMLTGFDKDEQLVEIIATQNVLVQFSSNGSTVDTAYNYMVMANTPRVLVLHLDYIDLTGDGTLGDAYLNFITKYDTYAIPTQLQEG